MLSGCRSSNYQEPRSPELVSGDLTSAAASNQWLTYGHAYDNERFSPADQVTVANAHALVPKFVVQTGEAAPIEATPIFLNGVLYIIGWDDVVSAIDGTTGQRLWQYVPKLGRVQLCCGAVSRGVASLDGMVFVAQLDDKLVALSQFTGRPIWSATVANPRKNYSMTIAPLAYRDKVFVGVSGGDLGIRGFLSAYSVANGKLLWKWYSTDPARWVGVFARRDPCGHPLHRNIEAERRAAKIVKLGWRIGGGAIWTTPAIDVDSNEVIFTTGNPWPDDFDVTRPGDNLFTDSIVALDADSGRLRWYFQEVPHDRWDWDPASPPVTFDFSDGQRRSTKLVAEAGKTGWVYILNRETGALVRCSQPFVTQLNLFSTKNEHAPGGGGGANWSPASVDPDLDLMMVMAASREPLPLGARAYQHHRRRRNRWKYYGTFSGIDLKSGKIVWQLRLPAGSVGGSTSTRGGITFFGDSAGFLNAVNTRTGELLWRFQTGAAVNATPIVYDSGGREYVIVASAGNNQMDTHLGDAIFAFGLP
jgi:alcohol dehydrogenase (cytochrome c)